MSLPIIRPKLLVNGQFVGYVTDVSYSRSAVSRPDVNGFEQYEPSKEITVSIQLTSPIRVSERWRLLEIGESIRSTDEFFHHKEQRWEVVNRAYWYTEDFNETVCNSVQVYRRKVLVIE